MSALEELAEHYIHHDRYADPCPGCLEKVAIAKQALADAKVSPRPLTYEQLLNLRATMDDDGQTTELLDDLMDAMTGWGSVVFRDKLFGAQEPMSDTTETSRINFGDRVKDVVTDYEGIVVSKHEYLNGCVRWGIEGKVKDGKLEDGHVIDEQRLVVIEKGVVPRNVEKPHQAVIPQAARTGGPRDNTPVKRHWAPGAR